MSSNKNAMIQARRLLFLARHPILHLYAAEGNYEGAPLRVIIADDGSTLGCVKDAFLPEGMTIHPKGIISAFSASKLCSSDADVVIIGANQLLIGHYTRSGFYIAPKYVRTILNITNHPEEMISQFNRSARREIKQVLGGGFTCETVTDPNWIDKFYYEMHKPYILKRFNERSNLSSYEDVKKAYEKGTALVITSDGEPVTAVLVYKEGSVLRVPFMGLYQGKEIEGIKGAAGAIYYYAMIQGHSWGCQTANFGHSRPFLSDGVLRYKLKWGMTVVDDDDGTAVFAIAAPSQKEQAQKFLANNRFYHIKNGKAVLYGEDESEEPA